MQNEFRFSVASAYRENSVCAIARVGVSIGALQRFYTTLHSERLRKLSGFVPGSLGEKLRQELDRRAFPGIPKGSVASVESGSELMHVLVRRLARRIGTRLSVRMMYLVAARFDGAVAQLLGRHGHEGVFVGMSAGSLESMRIARKQGGLAVLNFVNSHPVAHNRYLKEFAGIPDSHAEMIPMPVAHRIETELELADMILVPSDFIAGQLHSYGIPAQKVAVVPYGVDLSAFSPGSYNRPDRGGSKSILECLFVGQISHRKGVRILLEVARLCKGLPVRFRLLGPIVSPELVENLPENTTYDGAKVPFAIAEAMRRADIFVLPTIEDSFALVVFEAMASGLPVITTSHAGSSERILNGVDGFVVPPCDARAIVAAISRLSEDSGLREKVGLAARAKLEGAYCWDHYGKRVLDRISSLKSR